MNCSPQSLANNARCFLTCTEPSLLLASRNYLYCRIFNIGGIGANIVPNGAQYTTVGSAVEYDLVVGAFVSYVVTWGTNDLSMTLCGVNYPSTGVGTQTVVYTGSCTLMQFFGSFAGTTVTAMVRVATNSRIPIPSNFALVMNAAGTQVTASWDNPTLAVVTYTEVWTSSDGVTYSLAAQVTKPTNSYTLTAPAYGASLYVKIRWCNGPNLTCGNFTSPLNAPLTVVASWANRVVANGGAAVSQATISAVNTFYNSISGFASLFKCLNVVAPDSMVAAFTPLIVGSGSDPWTSDVALGAIGAACLTANGFNARADTGSHRISPGIIPSNIASFTVSNGGVSIYAFTLVAEGSNVGQCGVTDAAGRRFQFDLNDSAGGGSTAVMLNDFGTSSGGGGVGSTKGAGFYSMSRNAANALHCYYAKSSSAFSDVFPNTTGTNVTGPPQLSFIFAGYNTNGALVASNSTYSFLAIHDALTSAQAQNLYNAVQALRTALGGGFV